jgi:DNA (cytosine-5)-methyltransferase 1
MTDKQLRVSGIDLFCGAGGLTRGLEKVGIDVKLGIDIDPACEYPYSTNNNAAFLLKSVNEVTGSELLDTYNGSNLKLLAGCAPCQTFSSYNKKATSSDRRWWLLLQFSRLVKEIKPEIVTMENVPGLLEQDVFKDFVSDLVKLQYHIEYQVVDCVKYGLPQQRNRLVLLASKLGPISLISPKAFNKKGKTVKDAIGKLPAIKAGAIDTKDSLHQSSCLSELNHKRILVSKPGGTWRDWPNDIVADCHKKRSGKTYSSVYGRMHWNEPSPTITTQFYGFGNGRFGHPEQNRAISLREGAILQSFPKNYKFTAPGKPIEKKVIGRLIGNAVPVMLGEIIGKSILKHVVHTDA